MAETEKTEKKEPTPRTTEKQEEQTTVSEKSKRSQKHPSEIIFHSKPSRLLTLLLQDKQWHTAALARESNQSYVYATELIKLFERSGLVSVSSPGRRKVVKLTEKGERIANLIEDILKASSEDVAKTQQKTA